MIAENVAGIILAGGRSSRMGENKALLEYKGQPLVAHMIALLQRSGIKEVCISGVVSGFECIADEQPYAGPAAAILNVVSKLNGYRNVIFVPVDMPFLTPEILQELMKQETGAHYKGWPLPLYISSKTHLVYPDDPDDIQSVKKIIHSVGIKTLPFPKDQKDCFMNINTPEDYAWAQNQS